MLTIAELKAIARARLLDAEVLHSGGRSAAAAYLAGYAVEVALKARICETLKWRGFPETNAEFDGLQNLKTHRLSVLLRFSGEHDRIVTHHLDHWTELLGWDPADRYGRVGEAAKIDPSKRLSAARELVRIL